MTCRYASTSDCGDCDRTQTSKAATRGTARMFAILARSIGPRPRHCTRDHGSVALGGAVPGQSRCRTDELPMAHRVTESAESAHLRAPGLLLNRPNASQEDLNGVEENDYQ